MNKKTQSIFSLVFTIVILGVVGILMLISSKGAPISVNSETSQLEIGGILYAKTIDIDNTVQIELVSPKDILARTNGSAIGSVRSGYFTIEGDLAVYLNLGDYHLDWIEIIDGDEYYYINLKTETETTAIYNELLELLD
ncbi:MAG: hypothetical protein KKE16_02800 [Firmicutes bacterium]|nr:hypothetical protein [Bacillota bacterium]